MNTTPEPDDATSEQPAEHISGAHLATLWGKDLSEDTLGSTIGYELAPIALEWLRETVQHGRDFTDPATGKPETDPMIADVPVIPVEMVAEGFADRGLAVPSRQECRDFADKDGSLDPEIELLRARYTTDPDLDAAGAAAERRICGVPESVYMALPSESDRMKVIAGKVIAPPQSPTYVARWLAREKFSTRLLVPQPGSRRRRDTWARKLVRIDQTWYRYENTGTATEPAWRWVAHVDSEWMRGQLRRALAGLWYVKVKTRTDSAGIEIHSYSLKAWNPDDRSLTQVENALADELNVGIGTHTRELPDLYGRHHRVYSGGTRALVANGVLELETGQLTRNSALWFSLTRIDAEYDHAADPYADSDWLRILRTQWPDDPGAITCLQQWFGYVLSGRTDLQKWMFVVGPSGSGKSIIAEVLGALAGLVSATKLDELNSQFGLQALYETGAQLAVISDIRFSTRDSSTAVENLLAVTGEDVISVARKYKTAVSAKLRVRFHASANEIPRWADNSGALQKRLLVLRTTRAFRDTDHEDTGLKSRILANELGLVLRWAVEGLALLDAANGVFTRTVRAAELAEEVNDKAAPVRRFISDCCEVGGPDDVVDSRSLFDVWKAWAVNDGHVPGSHTNFRSALRALYMEPIKPGQRADKGQRVVWGIKRAATTYTDRDRFGNKTIKRIVSTDAEGDPMQDDGAA